MLVIVVNYNNTEDTISCLESVKLSSIECDVTLIDNGSSEESVSSLRNGLAEFSNVKLIESKDNLGFSGGVNLGLRDDRTERYQHILLLNNDAKVEEDTVEKLIHSLENNPDLGGVNPTIYDGRTGEIWFAGGILYKWAGVVGHNRKLPRQKSTELENSKVLQNGYLNGCCVLFRREVFDRIGELDEDLFMYGDDIDLSYRIRDAGWGLGYVPESTTHHWVSASTGQPEIRFNAFRAYYDSRNWILIQRKRGLKGAIPIICQLVVIFPYHIVLMLKQKSVRSIKWYIRGIIDGLRNNVGRLADVEKRV